MNIRFSNLLYTAALLAMAAHPAAAAALPAPVREGFDSWPVTTTWTNHLDSNGWSMADAQVRNNRNTWAPAYTGACAAWLHGTTGTSWVQSPLLPQGAEFVSFYSRSYDTNGTTGTLTAQYSTDLADWRTLGTFSPTTNGWTACIADISDHREGTLRLVQTGAAGSNTYIGLDQISIEQTNHMILPNPATNALRAYGPCSRRTPLIISEIMYHPPARPDALDLEFVEIFNTEPVPHDLSSFRLSGDVDYRFPTNFTLAARAFVVIARDPAAVQSGYAITNVAGPFTNALPHDSGTVQLRNAQGAILVEVSYEDTSPWPLAADGAGHSLRLSRPDYGEGDVRAWSASSRAGGSPGTADPDVVDRLDGLVINEFLAHTDLPEAGFIELYNRGTQTLDIAGCTLARAGNTNVFTVPPGTQLAPGGFACYVESNAAATAWPVDHTTNLGFSLHMQGSTIHLRNPDGRRVLDAVRYAAQQNGVAAGRDPGGAPTFHELLAPTPGAANAPLWIRDIVINEIMYAPISGLAADEYVELYNRGTQTVDLSSWRFVAGIDYAFPPGATAAPGAYVVVARDVTNLLARYPQLNAANTFGDYRGSLSDRGERLALAKPDDPALPYEDFVIVDEITYSDGWGEWSDGGGSSLELIDPRSDNRPGMNWAASDETQKAPWTTVAYTGRIDNGLGAVGELEIIGLQSGEFLLDDVELVREGDTANRIYNPGFESGLSGWSLRGNHVRSTLETAEGFASANSLHVRASERGDITMTGSAWTFYNQVATQPSPAPATNERFTLRAKVRWLCGYPYMLLGLQGFWLEAAGRLELPPDLGTPGLPNSRAVANAPPAISEASHSPLLPAAGQPVRVSARLHDPDGIAAAWLAYRADPSTNQVAIPMTPDGSGLYAAVIPGQSSGTLIAFTIGATDSNTVPASGGYPQGAGRECLVRFGDTPSTGVFGGYRLWLTAANQTLWNTRLTHDNEPIDLTLVVDGARAVYNGSGAYRGGWRTCNGPAGSLMCSYNLEVPKAERVLGDNEIKLDMTGFNSEDGTRQSERFSFWVARQLGYPYMNLRLVNVRVNGVLRQPLHDYQVPNHDFVQSWYPGDDRAPVFKQDSEQALTLMLTDGGERKQSRYRSTWLMLKPDMPSDDFGGVYALVDAFNLPYGEAYRARTSALADLGSWIGYFGVNHVLENIDSWGYELHHNVFLYLSRTRPGPAFLQDTDFSMYPRYTTEAQHDPFYNDDPVTARLFNYPPFRRAYWRLLKEAVNGPLLPERYNPVFDELDAAMTANGLAHTSTSTSKAWLADRRAYLLPMLATVNAPFAITSNGGADFSTRTPIIALAGMAPVEVADIRINGTSYPLDFPSVTNWTTTVPLQPGTNALTVQGVDRFGQFVAMTAITVICNAIPPVPGENVVINEIMYHAPVAHADYIELYNRATNETYNLAGCRLDGVDFTFPAGTLIRPGQYMVVADNLTTYTYVYTNAEKVIGTYDGELDNGGERLALLAPLGTNGWRTLDEVTYSPLPPWPTAADGGGQSLQLADPFQDNSRAGNWIPPQPVVVPPCTPGAPNSFATNLPAFPLLWLNEVMSSNLATVADSAGDHDPWVELYNAGESPIALDSYFLSNELADLQRWSFPSGAVITAGAHLLVWLDGETNQQTETEWHASFRINSTNGCVALARADQGRTTLVDALPYGALAPDHSLGTYPEGISPERYVFHHPTPGAANVITSDPAPIRINEWMALNTNFLADPADGQFDDWLELYNDGEERVPLDGYMLTDNPSSPTRFTIPAGVWLDGRSFLFIWADGSPDAYIPGFAALHANFSLSRYGEMITLYAPDGTQIDQAVYGPQDANASEGRWPNGSGSVHRMAYWPTPGASNVVFMIREMAPLANAGFQLSAPARSGSVFRVEYNDIVASNAWLLDSLFTADTAVASFPTTPAPPDVTQRFYRLIKQ